MSQNFKILSPREKILLRPARVIGDITTSKRERYYLDEDSVTKSEIDYNPGLNKIIREVIDNSIDEYIRTKGEYANKIDITISDIGEIEVKDNGRGIPISMTKDPEGREIMIPEAAWTRIDAGSNYDDEEDNMTIGQNGEGAALTNTFSIKFVGETTNV